VAGECQTDLSAVHGRRSDHEHEAPHESRRPSPVPQTVAMATNQRWLRILTVVDPFTRECLCLLPDQSLTGGKVAHALELVVGQCGTPRSITVDNGSEFAGRVMDAWAHCHGIQRDFIRPGKPVENRFIESVNGRLRDECLSVEVYFTLDDARETLAQWQADDNLRCPHSALQDQAPAAFSAEWAMANDTTGAPPELLGTVT